MYKTVARHCHGKIPEIGSGIGNISKYFIRDGYDILLSDICENHVEQLKSNFPTVNEKVFNLDLSYTMILTMSIHITSERVILSLLRRYTRKSLNKIMASHLQVTSSTYFNLWIICYLHRSKDRGCQDSFPLMKNPHHGRDSAL